MQRCERRRWPISPGRNGFAVAGAPALTEDRNGFLAIGPGGVYAVIVIDHRRSRVLIAGDVVQINGKRPAYIAEARREARHAGRALSAAVGLSVPVIPVLVFVGSGVISVHGLRKDVLIATGRDLDRQLIAGGARISPATASKLTAIAGNPLTWANTPRRPHSQPGWLREARDQQ